VGERRTRSIRLDPIWRTKAYRLATFLTEVLHADLDRMRTHSHLREVIPQLHESVCSIGTRIAEGYSRPTGKDRARLFEYGLGSAREARHWYFCARAALSAGELHARLEVLDEAIRLLVAMVTRQRLAQPKLQTLRC
jgi:four helix bundle protein